MYACDANWWQKTGFNWRTFEGVRISASPGAHILEGVDRVSVEGLEMQFAVPGMLGGGGNSGFQCVNLLAQMGVAQIALIGLDMSSRDARHWHGTAWPWSPPGRRLEKRALERWQRDMDAAAPMLKRRGVDVVNCSAISALTAFRRAPLNEVIDTWLN